MAVSNAEMPASPVNRPASRHYPPAIVIGNTARAMPSTFDLATLQSGPSTHGSINEIRPTSSSSGKARPVALRNNSSRRTLLYPQGDFRNSSTPDLRDLKADMMCNWLHQQQIERMWTTNGLEEGVMLKKAKDDYKCAPEDLSSRSDGIYDAVRRLNVKVRGATIRSRRVC